MRKTLFMLILAVSSCLWSIAQTRTITGKVVDENNKPVEGASVMIKGTTTGTAADVGGNFSINAKTGDVLVFSSTNFGMKEVKIGSSSSISVTLSREVGIIDEVVVTALGLTRNKNELGYASQQVSGDEVNKSRSSNFAAGLSGKVSGLDVKTTNTMGGSTNIVIRGYKSLTQNNQALVVVDGVPFDNSNTNSSNQRTGRGGYDFGSALSDINPDDIESVNVLKGAAATALYGSRAGNGVVLITTKKGKRGLGVSVNIGATMGKIDKKTYTEYQKNYGAGYGPANGYGSPDGNWFYFDVDGDGTNDLVVPTTEDASWGPAFDPNLMVYHWDAFDKTSVNYHKKRPWVAAANDPTSFFETAKGFNTSVLLDGASDKGTFKLGFGTNSDKGILPNSRLKKTAVNFGGTYNLTDRATVGASVNFFKTDGLGRFGTGYSGLNPNQGFRQWWQTNVDMKELEAAYMRTGRNITWNWADPTDEVNGLVPIYTDNPYWTRYENYENDTRFRYFGNVHLNYQITNWVSLIGRMSLDSYDEMQEERVAIGSADPGQYSRYNRTYRESNFDLMLNFDKDLSKDFNLKGLIGTNVRRQKISTIYASTNGGLVVPKLYALSNSLNPLSPPTETESEKAVDGYFGSLSLGYQELVNLDLTFRRDISSTLPEGANAYNYPSASLGFTFSKLLGNQAPWLSYGKLRTNYAEVGNDAPVHSTKAVYDKPTAFGSVTVFSLPSTQANTTLVPEKTKSFEVGLEMAFLRNRFGFDVTYYNAKTINQILPVSVSPSTGFSSMYVNAGTVQNKGIELSMFVTPVKTKDFSWTMNFNYTKNTNTVVELFDTATKNLQIASLQGGVSINATVGQPYGTIRGKDFAYDPVTGGKIVKANGYYKITASSNEIIGNASPEWLGGFNNTFKYKDLALSFLIDIRKGGDIFSLDMNYGLATGLYPETAGNNDLGNPVRSTIANGGGIIYPGISEVDGKENTKRVDISQNFGAYGYSRNPAKAFIYDGSYVKLRELVLTYSVPSKLVSKLKYVKGVDVSLFGRNLWIISKNLPYSDPEETLSSGNIQGYQSGAYPATKTYGFNLKFRF